MDWKNEFWDLYFKPDSISIANALALKEKNLPDELYRYRPATNLQYLEDEFKGNLYLPYIGDLNDPFDTCSLLSSSRLGDNYAPDIFRKDLEAQIGHVLPDELFQNSDWYANTANYLLKNEELTPEENQMALEILKEEEANLLKRTNDSFNDKAWSLLRVACFTEKVSNLPMWSHYANGHRGVCLKYSIKDLKDTLSENRMFPVSYVDNLPTAVRFLEAHRKDMYTGMFDYFAVNKLSDWSYEKEWRLVVNLASENYTLDEMFGRLKGKGIPYKFIKPSAVYIGAKAPDTLKQAVNKLAYNYGLKAWQMHCTEYGLQTTPIML